MRVWYTSIEHLCCLGFVVAYVSVLYLVPASVRRLPRNHPSHMKYRMMGASMVTILSMVFFYFVFPHFSISNQTQTYFEVLGMRIDNLLSSLLRSIALMTMLYAGPVLCQLILLYLQYSYKITNSGLIRNREKKATWFDIKRILFGSLDENSMLTIFRNIIFAPISEEIVFRALMVPLLYRYFSNNININVDNTINTHVHSHTHSSHHITTIQTYVIIICPMYFGVAHLHHFMESVRSGKKILPALIATIFQLIYTSLFGSIAVILFLRSGNIISPIASHIFCNIQGIPDIDFMKKPGDLYASGQLSCLYPYRYLLLLCHLAGLVLFGILLYHITSPLVIYSPYF